MKQRRGIRRFVIRAGIFLLLGAIVNVAVAWGCAVWLHPEHGHGVWWAANDFEDFSSATPTRAIPAIVRQHHDRLLPSSLCGAAEVYSGYDSFGADLFAVGSVVPDTGRADSSAILSGWPTRSVWGHEWIHVDAPQQPRMLFPKPWHQRKFGLFELWFGTSIRKLIPYAPIWPGFAINTLFYAAILSLLFAGSFALRRWRRIKRGLCPACAYPVGTNDLCTECGGYISPRRFDRPGS